MAYREMKLNAEHRAHDKQRSRDEDRQRLASGQVDATSLERENNFFAALDLPSFEIEAIGKRRVGARRP